MGEEARTVKTAGEKIKAAGTGKNQDRTELFERAPIPRAMAVMSIPMIISQLITLIYNMADTFFLGLTNDPYKVAASSLVLTLYLFTAGIANLFGAGGGSLLSRLLGAKEEEEARKVSSASLAWAAMATAAYSVLCFLFRNQILRFLGASDNTIGFARDYMLWVLVIGGIPTVLSMTMANLIRSIGNAKEAGFGLTMGGLLNLVLDPLFMFLILPDGQQVKGAAIATMLSNTVAAAYFIRKILAMGKDAVITFRQDLGRPRKDSIASIFSVGIPAAVSLWLFDLSNMVLNMRAAGHGDIALAAVGIVLKVERLPLNIGIGICIGMVPLIGYNYAAKNFERLDGIFAFGRAAGLIVALISVAMYRVFAPQIIRAFIEDPETVRIGTSILSARCFATPLMFLCFSMVHFFQAIGKGRYALILACVRQLVFIIPLLIILDTLFGMEGIVWTQFAGDLCTVIVTYLVYWKVYKKGLRLQQG